MEGQAYFTTLAGLGLSLAGFASLIAWLREDSTRWDEINLWRVKTIVRHALGLVFLCLVLVPIHELTGSTRGTVLWGSGGIVVFILSDLYLNRRHDPRIWVPATTWTIYLTGSLAFLLLQLLNLNWRSVGVLQLGVLLSLASPAGIFYNFVRELGALSVGAQTDRSQ